MLKKFLVFIACLFIFGSVTFAQTFWTIDYVRAKEGQYENYIEFLKQNWIKARIEAKKRKYIKSFRLLVLPKGSNAGYDFILMTEYADKNRFDAMEDNFKKVFEKVKYTKINGLGARELADIVNSTDVSSPIWGKSK